MPTPTTPTIDTEEAALIALDSASDDANWQKGYHYNNIVDGNLAAQRGFKTAHDYLASVKGLIRSQASLSLYGVVAKNFVEDVAKKYGCSKLNELIVYAHAKGIATPAGDPGDALIDVPQPDGSTSPKKFSECSVADLREAKANAKPADPLPQSALTRQAGLDAALLALLGKHGHVKLVPKMKDGAVAWTIHGDIPDALLSAVAGAIKDH
jgi:hypothetical protein